MCLTMSHRWCQGLPKPGSCFQPGMTAPVMTTALRRRVLPQKECPGTEHAATGAEGQCGGTAMRHLTIPFLEMAEKEDALSECREQKGLGNQKPQRRKGMFQHRLYCSCSDKNKERHRRWRVQTRPVNSAVLLRRAHQFSLGRQWRQSPSCV